jgi:hypothetical protein
MKYTKGILENIVAEGNATLLDSYDRYNQRMRVRFRCSCGIEASKRFEMLNLYRLPYCEACSKLKIIEKGKNTCMEKYGVDNGAKAPEVIKRIKDLWNKKS